MFFLCVHISYFWRLINQLSSKNFIRKKLNQSIHANYFCNISSQLRAYSKMNLADMEKLISDLKIPSATSKVTQNLFDVVKSLFACTKTLHTEIDQLKEQTRSTNRSLMSSLFSTDTGRTD